MSLPPDEVPASDNSNAAHTATKSDEKVEAGYAALAIHLNPRESIQIPSGVRHVLILNEGATVMLPAPIPSQTLQPDDNNTKSKPLSVEPSSPSPTTPQQEPIEIVHEKGSEVNSFQKTGVADFFWSQVSARLAVPGIITLAASLHYLLRPGSDTDENGKTSSSQPEDHDEPVPPETAELHIVPHYCDLLEGSKAISRCYELLEVPEQAWLYSQLMQQYPELGIAQYQLLTVDNNELKMLGTRSNVQLALEQLQIEMHAQSRPQVQIFFIAKSLRPFQGLSLKATKRILNSYLNAQVGKKKRNVDARLARDEIIACGDIPLAEVMTGCYEYMASTKLPEQNTAAYFALGFRETGLPDQYPGLKGLYVRYLPAIVVEKGRQGYDVLHFWPVGQLVKTGVPASVLLADNKDWADTEFTFSTKGSPQKISMKALGSYLRFILFDINISYESDYHQMSLTKTLKVPATGTYVISRPGKKFVSLSSFYRGKQLREIPIQKRKRYAPAASDSRSHQKEHGLTGSP